MDPILAFFSPGPMEMAIIGVVAVLLFGKRLPEVGRSLGKGLIEFKKGINGIEDDVDSASSSTSTYSSEDTSQDTMDDRDESTAPKFAPPTGEPTVEAEKATEEADQA